MRSSPYQIFFRALLTIGYCVALFLLYGGYVSIERTLLNIQTRLQGIEASLNASPSLQPTKEENVTFKPLKLPASKKTGGSLSVSPHIDPAYPNLLTEDPFYAHTLATLLPKGFKPGGTFHLAEVSIPDNLHPFVNWAVPARWIDMCTVGVASLHFGRYSVYGPEMALKIEQRPSQDGAYTEYWVHLRDDVYWQPLKKEMFPPNMQLDAHFLKPHLVTAEDFRFYFDALMNPWVEVAGAVAIRNYYADVESFDVIDARTFVVRWKNGPPLEADSDKQYGPPRFASFRLTAGLRPLARFVYQHFASGEKIIDNEEPDSYRTNSVWAHNFNEHWAKKVIVSCGAWIFETLSDEKVTLRRNPDHYEPLAALAEGFQTRFFTSEDAVWDAFKQGSLDQYVLPPDRFLDWEIFQKSPLYAQQKAAGSAINRLDYPDQLYSYIGWNMARPLFKERGVRQALTLAVDRNRLIEQILYNLGNQINGPFLTSSTAYNKELKPWPYDPRKARFLLEELGWKPSASDGILTKTIDGVPVRFSFSLTYYVKRPTSQAVAQFVALSLKEIGIEVTLRGIDAAEMSSAFDDRNFDAIFLSWVLPAPPEEPKQLWSSKNMYEKGSSNMVGFVSPEADAIMEKLDWEYRPAERIKLYHALGRILYDEAPYIFLYTPKRVLLYRERLQNVWIPAERQDLVPGASVLQPQFSICWLKEKDRKESR